MSNLQTKVVRQIESHETPADILGRVVDGIRAKGYKVVNIIETKVNKMPNCTDQAFLVVYDTDIKEGEEE